MSDWVEVALLEEIPADGRHAMVGDQEILLVREGARVYALGYLCSHQDMELEGGHREEGEWVCPHHGARFSLATGEATAMPAVDSVPTFDVKIVNGRVFVKDPSA